MKNIDRLMPHKPPMRMLESLVELGPDWAKGQLTIRPDNLFLRESGLLDRTAFPEIIAQCFAAAAGKARQETAGVFVNDGYLAAVRNLVVHDDARLGDTLDIDVRVLTEISGVTVLAGQVFCQKRLLAEGELKIYIPEPLAGKVRSQEH